MTMTTPRTRRNRSQPPAGGGLVVDGLSISFGGGVTQTVSDLSLTIAPGQCVALVGESGSGKSISARALLGLTPAEATVTSRTLRYDDLDLATLSAAQWRTVRGAGIGLVLQDALGSLDPLRRVGREVSEPLAIHQLGTTRERAETVRGLLDRVGIPQPDLRARQYPHELSGGLRQRALIASAIAAGPRLLLADEPTTALDVTVQARILDLLSSLQDQGTGILLISHDLAVVAELADHVVVLKDGRVVEEGPTEEILRSPQSSYTRRLLTSIPSAQSRGRSLLTGDPLPARTPASDSDTVVSVSHATKTYGRGRSHLVAVNDVSFDLRRGEVLGIVGESGSGKSTLGRLLLGQLPPDSGEIRVLDHRWQDVKGTPRRTLRRRIQMVSQDPLGSFDPRENVEQLVGEALPRTGRGSRRPRVIELLESVGLGAEHLTRKPRTLSGGQRQRVAIARALATEPAVLVCDEAVSALDVTVQAQVLDLLEHLRATTGVAIVFISHDLGVVHHIADRVLVMQDGVVVEAGEVTSVLSDPQHPYTQELIRAIPTFESRPPHTAERKD